MTMFYISAIFLVVLGFFFAVWPFFRQQRQESTIALHQERQAANAESFKDHLAELEIQYEQGQIDQAQYNETKAELERSLLEDNSAEVENAVISEKKPIKHIYWLMVLLALPMMVYLIYQDLGYKDSVVLGETLAEKTALEEEWFRTGDAQIEQSLNQLSESLVGELQSHIERHPEDLDSHVLLAREAMSVGQYDLAIETYQTILSQQPEAAQMMAELAQAVFIQSGNRAVPIVGILADRALQLQPNHVMALGLAGISAFQNANYGDAIGYWERAISLQPEGSTNARALINGIEQAKSRLAESSDQIAQDAAPTEDKAAVDEPSLQVTVALDQKVTTTQNAAVFIYARAWQGARVPLAITRVTVADLPLTVELTNAMSMAPGMNLSTADQVELIARVSESGTAIAQVGDWQASLGPVDVASSVNQRFELTIDTPYTP